MNCVPRYDVTYMYDDVTWATPLIRLTRLWRGGKLKVDDELRA